MIIEGAIAAACASVIIAIKPMVPTEDMTLTSTELTTKLAPAVTKGNRLVGAVAAWPAVTLNECTATIHYRDVVLYIGKELRGNRCAWKHIYEHEVEHVRIYNDALKIIENKVLPSLNHLAIIDQIFKEIAKVHIPHDANISAENARVCRGAIPKLIGLH